MLPHLKLDIEPQTLSLFEEAVALHTRGELDACVAIYQKVISLAPHYFPALSNLGAAYQSLRQFDRAIETYQSALSITQDHAVIHNNLGVALREQHQLHQAIQHYDQALRLDPQYCEAWVNRGFVHHQLGNFDLAIADYQKAQQINPSFAAASFNLSLTQLTLGDFSNGWRHYEWRFLADPYARDPHASAHLPRFDGSQPIKGKVVWLHGEQGLGDSLQFCRFALTLQDLGAQVILQVPQALVQVCRSLSSNIEVISEQQTPEYADYQCPLMSLGMALAIQPPHIAYSKGYLQAEPHKAAYWKKRLAHLQRMRIGLIWSGGFRPDQPDSWSTNLRRNLPIHYLEPLRHIHADFISLQKGQDAEHELIDAVNQGLPLPTIHTMSDELHDFSDTAALISQLDLVISVDTSSAHLAAALGKTTWILNRFDACWRWMIHTQDQVDQCPSPWYDSVKLYHQTVDGDWRSVLTLVTDDLIQLTDNPSHYSQERAKR